MPYAVTHILAPIIIVALIRDHYLKTSQRQKFPLHYVLIAGIGGVLPDIDIVISFFLRIFTENSWWIHKTFTHSVFFPLALLILSLLIIPIHKNVRFCNIRRHRLNFSLILIMLSIGSGIHLILDALFGTQAYLLYPFSSVDFGLNLGGITPFSWGLLMSTLDGILLVIWIVYLEWKHKISDFV